MSDTDKANRTVDAHPSDSVAKFLERLAEVNKKLAAAGISQKSRYRLIGPLTENPRRHLVRNERHTAGNR